MRYVFWNNKGGTGKTSLAFQTITEYAIENPERKILAVDLCPQANLSELFMGGLLGNGGRALDELYSSEPSRSIGGYFQARLPTPYQIPSLDPQQYISTPNAVFSEMPPNIDLIAGDRIVELQSNSISALSITLIPGVDTYIQIVNWLDDLLTILERHSLYDDVFIDTNPSFAIYTQIALAASERLIIPVMADDSSRRALRNIFSLVYGLDLPSSIYNNYAFNAKLRSAGKELPKVHLVVKNRLTQYMEPASAYASVLSSIDRDLESILQSSEDCFTFSDIQDGIAEVRDFQTTGVVAFAKATPFSKLTVGNHDIFGNITKVKKENLTNCRAAMKEITDKI